LNDDEGGSSDEEHQGDAGRAPQIGRLSFRLKSIGGPDYDDWKKTEPLVDGFVPVSQSDSMLRDDNNTNMTVAARKHPSAPNALLPCHLQPCGMRTVDKATLCNSGTNALRQKLPLAGSKSNFRFTPESRLNWEIAACPKCANKRHRTLRLN
jgi:hypothetical protein